MNDSTTKACRRCCEQIALGAQRCPKCQSWQGVGAYLAANPIAIFSIPLGFVPLFMMFWIFWPGADFGKYQDKIIVVEPQLVVNADKSYDGIVTVGKLENQSPLKWKDIVIEVQYFDQDGKLVAAATEKSLNMVLLPGVQHAFNVSSNREHAAEKYVSQKVFVRDARDARKWP